MSSACGTRGKRRNASRFLVGKPERKRETRRLECRYEGNIKMGLKEMGSDDVDWIYLAQDRDELWVLANEIMNCQFLTIYGVS